MVPSIRIRALNGADFLGPDDKSGFVLYWMTAFRRPRHNFALQRAVELANELGTRLLVFEPLRVDYRWACARFHRFIIDGMQANSRYFASNRVNYLPLIEQSSGESQTVLAKLLRSTRYLITDNHPGFFHPALIRKWLPRFRQPAEAVDSNGILPLAAAGKSFLRAYDFRNFLQRNLREHLLDFPSRDPCQDLRNRSPIDCSGFLKGIQTLKLDGPEPSLASLPINHEISATQQRGGYESAESLLREFVKSRLNRYHEQRNQPELAATSGLSGYLHFGHISPHQILDEIFREQDWTPKRLAPEPTRKATGWWGLNEAAEGFLDQLVTWRELGFLTAWHNPRYRCYSSLPAWAQKTLDEHRADPRTPCYELESLDQAKTEDPLWNAAQNQLKQEGIIHNYLRMLWGKKILEWSASPEKALANMIELNNRYAIDGRDPNSYSGIFWVLGRFDRAWGPERSIFGKIRYMTSRNTARKFPVTDYIRKYTAAKTTTRR